MPLLESDICFSINNLEQYEEISNQLNKQLLQIHSTSRQHAMKIAVFEAVHNAIEHGKLPITIHFNSQPSHIMITVKDQGEGFKVSQKVNLIEKKGIDLLLDEQKFCTRGRGILMMYKLVSKVTFNDKGNEVSLIIKAC